MVTETQRGQHRNEVLFVDDADDTDTLVNKVGEGLIADTWHAECNRIDGNVHRGLRGQEDSVQHSHCTTRRVSHDRHRVWMELCEGSLHASKDDLGSSTRGSAIGSVIYMSGHRLCLFMRHASVHFDARWYTGEEDGVEWFLGYRGIGKAEIQG